MSDSQDVGRGAQQALPLGSLAADRPSEKSEPAADVSVVVPVFNEEDCIEPLVSRISATMHRTGRRWEMILVDDGSTDSSLERSLAARRADAHVRVLRLRANSGQSAALDAGFRSARGDWVVTLDADLQNPPEEIPKLLAATAGTDMVYGRRVSRRDPFVKRVSSRIGNGVRNWITGHDVRDTGCSLKAFRRNAVDRIPTFRGMHRFLPSLFAFHGLRIREVSVEHAERHAGISKYGVGDRAWRGLVDCFGVRWMKSRALSYDADGVMEEGGTDH